MQHSVNLRFSRKVRRSTNPHRTPCSRFSRAPRCRCSIATSRLPPRRRTSVPRLGLSFSFLMHPTTLSQLKLFCSVRRETARVNFAACPLQSTANAETTSREKGLIQTIFMFGR
jgi:hypothetical protein